MVVTIDGPAGAGKSSAARALAARLGFEFLDTGAMFRAVTLAAFRAGVDAGDEAALASLLSDFHLELSAGSVRVNGEDVTTAIRGSDVTARSGKIADSPVVRKRLAELQRAQARDRNIISEGRDQGTVVFPQAECKFFLVADPAERARRRHGELTGRGEKPSLDEVLEAQQARDARDAARALAPMVPADDAIVLDSTHLTLEQVVDRMEEEVRRRMNQHD